MKIFKDKKVKIAVQDPSLCRLPRARTSSLVVSRQEKRILGVLGTKTLTARKIAQLTRIPTKTVRVRLRTLREQGKVKKLLAGPATKYCRK
ncbi:hypothetical protein IJI99_03590 [bacterium]|nr:hypothetical protein [bacterium]